MGRLSDVPDARASTSGRGLSVSAAGLGKSFSGAQALKDVTLEVGSGAFHALVGENGAGKSTLGRIVAGLIRHDAGTLAIDGEVVQLRSPRDGRALGITTLQQELSVVPHMTVAENVFLGDLKSTAGFVNRRAQEQATRAVLARLGYELDPGAAVASLSLAERQRVEIARAVAQNAALIVVDEATAALTAHESRLLLDLLREINAGGTTIVFVSHFLDEVLEYSDAVTVLRNGEVVLSGPTAEQTETGLITAMLGRASGQLYPDRLPPPPAAAPVFAARGLTRDGAFSDVSFELAPGEVVGIAGLVGSGRTEVARALVGADRTDAGELWLDGDEVRFAGPRQALAAGVTMLPESRREQGLLMDRPVFENVTLPHLATVSRLGFVRRRQERRRTDELLGRVSVVPRRPEAKAGSLSGGNQQKVLLARCLLIENRVLIVDEPTRGVDIGAKTAIYELLLAAAAAGTAVLLISSDLEEVVGLSHRVLVMRFGRVIQELRGDDVNISKVMFGVFGAEDDADAATAAGGQ